MHIKSLFYAASAAALLALAMPLSAAADDSARPYHGLSQQEREEVRERWAGMSAEERAELRRKADAYWAGLSEEEREARREELRRYHRGDADGGMHSDWHAMSPEERQAQREEMRERWQNMTPEEREAHRGMMRSPRADEVRRGADGGSQGKDYGKDGKYDGGGKDKAKPEKATEPKGRY
jgi:hypothetical protein